MSQFPSNPTSASYRPNPIWSPSIVGAPIEESESWDIGEIEFQDANTDDGRFFSFENLEILWDNPTIIHGNSTTIYGIAPNLLENGNTIIVDRVCPSLVKIFVSNLPRKTIENLTAEETTCSICYEPFTETDTELMSAEMAVQLSCGHVFGDQCLTNWLNADNVTCPMCRGLVYDIGAIQPQSALDDLLYEVLEHLKSPDRPSSILEQRIPDAQGNAVGGSTQQLVGEEAAPSLGIEVAEITIDPQVLLKNLTELLQQIHAELSTASFEVDIRRIRAHQHLQREEFALLRDDQRREPSQQQFSRSFRARRTREIQAALDQEGQEIEELCRKMQLQARAENALRAVETYWTEIAQHDNR